jgi:hypothetical protein
MGQFKKKKKKKLFKLNLKRNLSIIILVPSEIVYEIIIFPSFWQEISPTTKTLRFKIFKETLSSTRLQHWDDTR